MAAVTYGAIPATAASAAKAAGKPSLLRRIVDRLIEARSRQAEAYVRTQLLALDAQTLARLGYDRDQLKRESQEILL